MLLAFLSYAAPAAQMSASADGLRWEKQSWGRKAALTVPAQHQPGFELLSPDQTGVHFTNVLSDARAAENQIRLNGSGVALGDVDGDGWCDIYLCGLENGNRLYRNLGNWKFEDITASAGVACEGQFSTGATLADVDGDGDLDLLVNGIATGTRLFLNDGKGHFTESADNGLVRKYGATTLALADIDGDGDLDLYVANYRTDTVRTTGLMFLRQGERRMVRPEDKDRLEITPDGRVLEFGEPDFLYLNDGKGHFTPVSWTSGRFLDEDGKPLTRPPFDWSLTVVFRDLNGDGFPDLYVTSDFQTEDRIWLNDGHGIFRAAPPLLLRHTSSFSMCVDVADMNRDGYFDLFVADMLSRSHPRRLMQLCQTAPYTSLPGLFNDRPQFERNTLQLNRGDGTFAEIAAFAGLAETEWNWMAAFIDVDLDGYEDLLCTTSHEFDIQDMDAEMFVRSKGPWPRERIPEKLLLFPKMSQPKQAFRNRGDLTFEDAAKAWGFNQVGVSQGMAFADLDNDGFLDVVVNNLNAAAGIYRNKCSAPRIAVRLKGLPPNTRGIGAKVSLVTRRLAPEKSQSLDFVQSQEICAGGRYLSSDEPIRVFAADAREALLRKYPGQASATAANEPLELRLEVTWRSGKRTVIDNAEPNTLYEISESGSQPDDSKQPKASAPLLFEDVSDHVNHAHVDTAFDDFQRQPLLPRKLSQGGPGISWYDVDGDGYEDLIITSGRGGHFSIFHNDGHGSFSSLTNAALQEVLSRDQTTAIAFSGNPGSRTPRLLVGSSNYKDGQASGALAREYDLGSSKVLDSFPGQEASSGPLAMADVDGDGTLDLFVGGRCIPGKWPAPATSLLFLNHGGRFSLDTTNTAKLADVGLVSGAIFADLNGDGWPDLLLACEWGPIRVFLNEHGALRDATAELGLASYVGWWNGITVGDFDGDGRLDIAASNWGLNGGADGYQKPALVPNWSPTRPQPGVPLLFYGDFGGGPGTDLLEAEYDPELGKEVPIRALVAVEEALPFVRSKFQTYAAFNRAGVSDILGDQFASSHRLAAPWLASTVFLNRNGKFEPVALPPEAQFAPAFGICTADFDGDRHEDLFLAQNFFAVQPQAVRCDAGRGLLLRGDGHGHFETVPGQISGVSIYGEGRGAAVCDFDEDGRADLAVGQNGAQTKLFHNLSAKPGLRVRARFSEQNPQAIGAQICLIFGKERGPVREIHAGSGYWSQDSAVEVMATPTAPSAIWVRWPGGRTNEFGLPPSGRMVNLTPEGAASK